MSRQRAAAGVDASVQGRAGQDRYFRYHLGITTLAGLMLIAVLSAPRDATEIDCSDRVGSESRAVELAERAGQVRTGADVPCSR